MTVKEFIDILSKFDPNKKITMPDPIYRMVSPRVIEHKSEIIIVSDCAE